MNPVLTPAEAASGAGRAAGIVSPPPAVVVPSLVLTQPRNSPGQALPEQELLRDPFPWPSSSWAQRGDSNCVARRGDSRVVAAQAIPEQLEPPHIVRLDHQRAFEIQMLKLCSRDPSARAVCGPLVGNKP